MQNERILEWIQSLISSWRLLLFRLSRRLWKQCRWSICGTGTSTSNIIMPTRITNTKTNSKYAQTKNIKVSFTQQTKYSRVCICLQWFDIKNTFKCDKCSISIYCLEDMTQIIWDLTVSMASKLFKKQHAVTTKFGFQSQALKIKFWEYRIHVEHPF